MTSYDSDVDGIRKSFSTKKITDDGKSVSITGTHANGDDVTIEISLRVVQRSDGLDVGPKTVTIHGPRRELEDGGTEDAELSVAYSSDIPPGVKSEFKQYVDENRIRLLEERA